MASPSDKLANSLSLLKVLLDDGKVAIRANDLTRIHRERLVKYGFLQEVMKGWYVPARPDDTAGESTGWYASFWGFCADYLNTRFGDEWCLNPEQSISLHAGDWSVPPQLLVRSPKGGNKPTGLLYGTSIFDVRLALPAKAAIEIKRDLRAMKLPAALIACGPGDFASRPITTRAALAMIRDASEILSGLLSGGHSKIAGRLAGAFRNIGRTKIADDILATMRTAGYTVQESNPFTDVTSVTFNAREKSPYVTRMRMMWAAMRGDVLQHFPAPPGLPTDKRAYLHQVDGIYVSDAYNSLSIEGYRVSTALIERVRSGNRNPDNDENDALGPDRENRNALAARGYWQAFQYVKDSVEKVLANQNAGAVADADHGNWYRELFGPSVTAGIIQPADLAGYRNGPVYIRRSMHVPPSCEAVRDLIPAFFELLQTEAEPAVRAVLGHFMFVYIHPYFDGNGRMGRFLMNVMLASGGYPWTIVLLDRRDDYMAALESASVKQDVKPFAIYLSDLVNHTRMTTHGANYQPSAAR
ncbi:MAG: Fic family protein [Gammaproteobacteria bacterium]